LQLVCHLLALKKDLVNLTPTYLVLFLHLVDLRVLYRTKQ